MTPHQKDKKSMYDTVLGIFDKFTDLISTIPELVLQVASFRSTVALISEHNDKAKTVKSGKYEAKVNTKHDLISLFVPAVKSLRSYARKNKLQDIIKLTEGISQSNLTWDTKAEFDEKIDTLYKLLDDNKANLTGYNVTAEKVAALKTSVDTYKAAEKVHLASGSEKSAAHISLEEAFDIADDILKEDIDGMMEHFRQDNKEFYNTYNAGRVIKDISGNKGNDTTPPDTPPPDSPQQPQ